MNETATESAKTDEDKEFIRFVWKLVGWGLPSDDIERCKVVITPYSGNYGAVAGHVIAIEGSPPKGVVYVPSSETAVVFGDGNAKTIRRHLTATSTRKLETVLDYLKHRGYEAASPI